LILKEHAVKKSRYTEEQIAYAMKQAETGTPVAEVIRRMGISEQTFYRWKKLYGGLGVTSPGKGLSGFSCVGGHNG
jgi:transposase-like protein